MHAVMKVFTDSGMNSEDVIRLLGEASTEPLPEPQDFEWSSQKNARRLALIDKKIQQTITSLEAVELQRLTGLMRSYCDREETVPLEGARKLHRRLLGMADSEGPTS